MAAMFRTVWFVLSACTWTLSARAQDATASEQEPPIDRLQHPAGTVTGKAGIAQVERGGHGPVPLLLLPGAPFGWRAWEDFMARHEERYTMLAVTPAGYAGTPPPPMPAGEEADYTARAWTEPLLADLVKLLESEPVQKLGPVVVVGHHLMSDYYAVRLAAEHPELVRAVVAVAGLGSVPMPQGQDGDAKARAHWVRENRAPFFRTVSQQTWNAGTFPASALSKDEERGRELFDAQIAVPISTQVRYYLEYMTDEVEPYLARVRVPVLSLESERRRPDLDALPQSMKDMLVQRFGSLEKAREQVKVAGSPWGTYGTHVDPALWHTKEIAAGSFLMQDAPGEFDAVLTDFIAALPQRKGDAEGTPKSAAPPSSQERVRSKR
jgi:pimeloyl-ACP methyl ester carboxylesterase